MPTTFVDIFTLRVPYCIQNKAAKMATAVKSIKTDSISPIKIKATAGKAFDIFRYISGYYEEVDDEQTEELNKGCGISVNIKETIQNYGNAMNYYVQVGGCRVKYLRLVRLK